MSRRALAIGKALLILFTMSLGTVLTKSVLEDIPPFTFAWTSIAVGMIVLSIYTFIIRKEKVSSNLSKEVWKIIIAIGIGNFAISRLTRPIAIHLLPVTTVAYIGNFIGILTMAMSIFILKEIPTVFQVLGATIAIGGITVYFQDPLVVTELFGIGLILLGITAVAYTNNVARKVGILTKNSLSNNIVSTVALLIGGSLAVIAGLVFDFPPNVPNWRSWAIIVYAGIVNVSLGLTVWNHILRVLRSYEASILGISSLIFTTLLAMLLLNETVSSNQWTGISLMILGLILVQVRTKLFRVNR